nr:ankyrin repeat domain-containing protein 36C-like isoform X7 [Peromyscus maniculatus bairdii]
MEIFFPKKERTPLGFCDGLDKIFMGFGNEDERGCQPPKYHTSYAPYYPIHKAASMGDIDTVKSFVKRGVFVLEQIDWKYRTALHFACVYGHPEVVAFLVENSCEISPKDIKDATPLIKAAQCRQTECLDILLKYGADPDIIDCRGNTALHYAVYNGDVKTAAKLLEYRASIEAVNENKITPLLLALKQNKEKMAEFLINKGANTKTCDFLGRSTLMYAVRCGSELIIKLLLQRGIDTFKQDAFGWTAKRYAVESKSKVRTLLIDYDEEELRQTCLDIMKKDACSMPFQPTSEVKHSLQSEEVEKTEAKPSKSGNTEKDARSMPTTEVEDSPQSEAMEKAEARPSKLEPGLRVSSEKKSKKCDHKENNRPLKFFERVFRDSHSSGTRDEESKDITKGRVLAWVEKDDLSKPRTTEKKSSTDEVEIITLKSFKSDLSLEVVIEVSSEEEQKGEDDDNDDVGNGIAHLQHSEEEIKQTSEKSNQGTSPSNKTSIQKEVEDPTEDSKGVTTEQPLGKDEEPKAQKNEDSNEVTEEEARKQSVGKSSQGSLYKKSTLQKFEDSSDDSESIFECLVKKGSDHFHGAADQSSDDQSGDEYVKAKSDLDVTSTENQKTHSDSTTNLPLHFPQKEETDDLTGSACLQGHNTAIGQIKAEPVAEATSEEEESEAGRDSTQASSVSETYGLKKIWGYLQRTPDQRTQTMATGEMNAEMKEVTSRDEQSKHESSTSDHSWTTSDPLPQKVDVSHLARSRDQRGENTAREELKGNEVTSIEKYRRLDSSESIESLPTAESPLQRQDVGHLPETDDPRRETTGNGEMKVFLDFSKEDPSQLKPTIKKKSSFLNREVAKRHERSWESADPDKEMISIEEQRSHMIGERVESLQSATGCTEQKEDVGHLAGAGDQGRESMTRYTMRVALCREVSITEEQSRQDSQESVQSSVLSEPHLLKEDVVHFAGIPVQEKENIASIEMKVSSIEVTSTEEHKMDNTSECSESMPMSECLLQKRDVSRLPGTADQRRKNITSGEMKGSPKDYMPQFKPIIQKESSFEYTAVVSMHESTSESEEPDDEVPSTEELTRPEDHQNVQSWTTSETFSQEDNVVPLAGTTDEGPEDVTNAEVQAVPDKGMISTEQQKHDSHGNSHSLTTPETSTYMEDVVHFSVLADQILESMANAETKDKEVTSEEEQSRHRHSERPLEKEDVCHLAVSIEQRSENVTNGEMEDLCKEVILTEEEQRRYDIHGGVQSLIVSELLPQKNVIHLPVTTDQRIENKSATEMKVKPDRGVMTSTEEQIRHESRGRLGSLAVSESLPQRDNVGHLAASEQQRKENVTNAERYVFQKESPTQFKPVIEMEYSHLNPAIEKMTGRTCQPATNTEMASTEEPRRNAKKEKLSSLIVSATPSTKENQGPLAETVDQRGEDYTSLEMNAEPRKEGTSRKEQRKHDGRGKAQSLVASENIPQKQDVITLTVTTDQRRQTKPTMAMKGPCKEETTTEDEIKCYSHESVQSSILSEPLAQKKDVVYSPKISDQRGENVASGHMTAEPNLYVTSEEEQNRDDSSNSSQSSLKRKKKKTGCSPKMDTVEKPPRGNIAAAAFAVGGGADVAAAISDNGGRNGFALQKHCGKSGNHELPVTTKKHVGSHAVTKDVQSCTDIKRMWLNKKTCDEKNKAVEHMDAIDDHQLSESVSENDDLPDYDNILMIVDQLQMNYKDSGRQLEIQDAVHSYKMIIGRNQSHSELLIEISNKIKNQAGEVLKKPQETEKRKSQLRCKNEEQQLELIDVGLAGKQEAQQRNPHSLYEKIKKQLSEKEEQYKKEKQQLETHLGAQDMELRHLRNDINKLQEARNQEAKAEDSDGMRKGHLQKVEQEIFKLKETIKKQAETLEQLEKKLLSKDKSLVRTDSLIQAGQEFFTNFREIYTTSVMNQLELRIQSLESKISEMKIQTCDDVIVLENYNKLHQSHKLRQTEAQLKEVTAQFLMLIQHNMSLLNMLSSILASECCCVASFQSSLGSLFTQENMVTPTSGPQSSKHHITANLGVSADGNEDFNKELIKLVLCPQPELDHTEKKRMELAKEKTLSKKCFKWTKTSAERQNGEQSYSDVSNTRQFEKDSPIDLPRHEIREENQQTFDDIIGNRKALCIRPQKSTLTNLQSKYPEELTHHTSYKTEPKQYEDPYLEMVKMTKSLSRKQLKSKDRRDEAMRNNFEKMKLYGSALNMYATSPAPGFAAGHPRNSRKRSGSFIQEEPLVPGSRPLHFVESLGSYLGRTWQQLYNDYY